MEEKKKREMSETKTKERKEDQDYNLMSCWH